MERDAAVVAFYHSGRWTRTRAAYLDSRHHICERCGGIATMVHHRQYITADTVCDDSVTLAWDNLCALCQSCHLLEHRGDGGAYRVTRSGLRFDARGELVPDGDGVSG